MAVERFVSTSAVDLASESARVRAAFRTLSSLRQGYSNWPRLAASIGFAKLGRRSGDLLAKTRHGSRIRCPNAGMARSVLAELYGRDEYHLAELRPRRQGAPTVIDIGAHVGIFAIELCERFPGARVWSFEPSPVTFAYLLANVQDNGLTDAVQVFNLAVSSREGALTFFEDERGSAANTAFPELLRPGQRRIEVRTRPFSSIIAGAGEHIDLVKIDCEGGEYAIVIDSADRTWDAVDNVALEYHPVDGHSWDELDARLRGLGFTRTAHEVRGAGWGTAYFARRPGDGRTARQRD